MTITILRRRFIEVKYSVYERSLSLVPIRSFREIFSCPGQNFLKTATDGFRNSSEDETVADLKRSYIFAFVKRVKRARTTVASPFVLLNC